MYHAFLSTAAISCSGHPVAPSACQNCTLPSLLPPSCLCLTWRAVPAPCRCAVRLSADMGCHLHLTTPSTNPSPCPALASLGPCMCLVMCVCSSWIGPTFPEFDLQGPSAVFMPKTSSLEVELPRTELVRPTPTPTPTPSPCDAGRQPEPPGALTTSLGRAAPPGRLHSQAPASCAPASRAPYTLLPLPRLSHSRHRELSACVRRPWSTGWPRWSGRSSALRSCS